MINPHADVHHMEMFGKAVAVNSTKGLLGISKAKGWKTINWQ
jgi:hypothetical protein